MRLSKNIGYREWLVGQLLPATFATESAVLVEAIKKEPSEAAQALEDLMSLVDKPSQERLDSYRKVMEAMAKGVENRSVLMALRLADKAIAALKA